MAEDVRVDTQNDESARNDQEYPFCDLEGFSFVSDAILNLTQQQPTMQSLPSMKYAIAATRSSQAEDGTDTETTGRATALTCQVKAMHKGNETPVPAARAARPLCDGLVYRF